MRRQITRSLWIASFSVAIFARQVGPVALVEAKEKQSDALAPQWILTPDPRYQAWAAYPIARDRRTDQLPLLLNYVSSSKDLLEPVSAADFDRVAAMNVALDALIQLRAKVPGRLVQALFQRFPAQAVILLTAAPEENREILFDRATSSEVWLAAGNLLAAMRSPGFAAR